MEVRVLMVLTPLLVTVLKDTVTENLASVKLVTFQTPIPNFAWKLFLATVDILCKTEIHRICKSNNVCSLFHTDNNFISGFIKWQEGFGECSHLTEESHITEEPQVCERVFPMLENVNENVDFNSCYYTKMTNFCGIQMLHEISNPEKTP